MSILRREETYTHVRKIDLRRAIMDLVNATGRGVSKEAQDFQSHVPKRIPHKKISRTFERIAASDDPLGSKLCSRAIRIELDRYLRVKWSSRVKKRSINRPLGLKGLVSADLTEEERSDIREAATHLAALHKSQVRRQQPTKVDQNALVHGLAVIYIQFAALDCDVFDLPYSVNSRFIAFCHAALQPFFAQTEASRSAIAQRWYTLKKSDASGREESPADDCV